MPDFNLFILNQSLEGNELDWDFLETTIECLWNSEVELCLYFGF